MKNQTPTNKNEPGTGNRPAPAASACPALPTQINPTEEGYISKEALAQRLGKTIRTVENWQRRGIIPYIKCGHSALFKWTDVEAHLHKNFRICRKQPQPPTPEETHD